VGKTKGKECVNGLRRCVNIYIIYIFYVIRGIRLMEGGSSPYDFHCVLTLKIS